MIHRMHRFRGAHNPGFPSWSFLLSYFPLFALMFGSSPALGQSEFSSNGFVHLSEDEVERDLDSLSSWVLATHPAPFAYCSEEEWFSQLEQNKKMLKGGGNLFAVAKAFADQTRLLKDSHTGIALQSFANQLASSNGQISIEVTTVDNQTVLAKDWNNEVKLGTAIDGIAGISSRSLLGMALSLVPQEGEASLSRLRMAEKLWNDLVPFALGGSVGDSLTISHADSSIEQRIQIESKSRLDSIRLLHESPEVSWGYVPKHPEVLQLTIRSFHPKDVREFKKQLKSCFREIHRAEKDKNITFSGLVLDLRHNPGGQIAVMAEVLPYLTSAEERLPYGVQIRHSSLAKSQIKSTSAIRNCLARGYRSNFKELNRVLRSSEQPMSFVPFEQPIKPRKRFNYTGQMTLLLDGLSASASVSLAAWFVRTGRGKTFGEPPMGSISGTFGNPIKLALPSSGIKINIATARYYTQAPIRWESNPLFPDYPVAMTVQDLIDGKDRCLENAARFLENAPSHSH